ALIVFLGRRISDPGVQGRRPRFDVAGAVLSAAGLLFIVLGILQSGTYGWFKAREDFAIGGVVIIQKGGVSPVWLFVAIGALILLWFFVHIRSRERAGKEPLLSTSLFRNRTSNLGLLTQNIQWLILQGSSFVISVFLQTVRHYSAIETGLILTPATVGILVASAVAGRMAIVGSVLVASTRPGNGPFGMALLAMVITALVGLGAAMLLPPGPIRPRSTDQGDVARA